MIAMAYDPLGNVLQIDRTFGATTVTRTFVYDSLGRRIENADPDSGLWLYEYDDAGDLVATEDASTTRVSYTYDQAGRLLTEDHGDDQSVEVTYGYDDATAGRYGLARLTSASDQSGELELDYDERGRTVALRRTLDFDQTEREEQTSYDEQDRVLTQQYPDGSVASYEYTDRGLLYAVDLLHDADLDEEIDDVQPVVARLEYDASGQRVVLERGDADATTTEYTYDDRLRLATLHTETSESRIFQDLAYSYDRVSNIVAIDDLRDESDTTGWSPSPVDQEYEYDALYRLTQVESTYDVSEPTRPVTQTWAYDFLGNMTSWTDDQDDFYDRSLGAIENGVDTDPDVRPSALVSATLDGSNHLEADYTDTGDLESLSVTKGGNTTVTDLVWDPVHRLDHVTIGATTTEFTYDYSDQRRVKDGGGETVLYVSDDFEVRDTEATKWLMVGTDRILRVTTEASATQVSFYLPDHLGTSSIVLDAADSEPRVASTSLPYGATEAEVVSDAGFEAEYEFTGKERDEETGLDYFGARYYAANLGRWVSPDPKTAHSGSGQAVQLVLQNPYLYARARPLEMVDPDGEDPVLAIALAAGAISSIFAEASEVGSQMSHGASFFQVDERRVIAAGVGAFVSVAGTTFAVGHGGPAAIPAAAVANVAGGSAARAIRGEGPRADEIVSEAATGATEAMGGPVLQRISSKLVRAGRETARRAARALADVAQGSSPRPGAAAALEVEGRTFTGVSGRPSPGRELHPRVEQALDAIPASAAQ